MRIEVVGADTISQQARTYAEYRVFAALTQFADAKEVSGARVVLRAVDRGRGSDSIACTVSVALEGGLLSNTNNRSPRLRRDQPRGRTSQNHGRDRIGRRLHLHLRPAGDENDALLPRALCVTVLWMVRGTRHGPRAETSRTC